MFTNSRRRLVGILTAIAAPALVAAIALPAHALTVNDSIYSYVACSNIPGNLVSDCGFEATPPAGTAAAGWNHVVNIDGFRDTSEAHSGTHALSFGSTGADDVFTQTFKVAPHTQYLVSAWIDATNSGTANNDFGIAATNISGRIDATTIAGNSNYTPGWQQVGGLVTTYTGTTMTLVLRGENVPAHTYVDDIVVIPQRTGCAPIANNLVENCGFEGVSSDPWVKDTNIDTFVATNTGNGGTHSLGFGSTTTDDRWHQVLTVRPHTAYTLSFSVEVYTGGGASVDDLSVSVSNVPAASGGVLRVVTPSNIANRFWVTYTKTFVTGNGSTATLTIAGKNVPHATYVDDVSVTAVPHVKITHSGRVVTVTLTGLGGQKVYLEKLVGSHWVITHTWIAPKTGWTKSWALTVGSAGAYRAVAASAPGYGTAVGGPIAVH